MGESVDKSQAKYDAIGKWHAPCLRIVLSSGDNRRNEKNQNNILLRHQDSNHPYRPPLVSHNLTSGIQSGA